MKNPEVIDPFHITVTDTGFGTLTSLTAEAGIAAKESIGSDGNSLLTSYVYRQDGTYTLVYTVVAPDGGSVSYAEDDGILPTLFLCPQGQAHVSIVPYHPDKELEISIPVFQRDQVELPKAARPFVGNFIGATATAAIFHDTDWSDKKPDKLLAIGFADGRISNRHGGKLPLPASNKIVANADGIQLLAQHEQGWLHRQVDEQGRVVRERTVLSPAIYCLQILDLSFERTSYLLAQEDGKIVVVTIGADGSTGVVELMDFTDEFYNTWMPVDIGGGVRVTRFNDEFGNGWLTTRGDQLLEFFHGKDEAGYRNLLTGELIPMPQADLVISSVNKTGELAYAVVLYPMAEDDGKNNQLLILNRSVS